MIPISFVTEWSKNVPWQTMEQVEHDLLICQILGLLFKNCSIADSLIFRDGTALNKVYLQDQARFSSTINLVKLTKEPMDELVQKLVALLAVLGHSIIKLGKNFCSILLQLNTESNAVKPINLKIDINNTENFTILGNKKIPFEVNSPWFNDKCELNTYHLEELLGLKLRALYHRKKGRDLFDIYKALVKYPLLDLDKVIFCYHNYMDFIVDFPPTQKMVIANIANKMKDAEFLNDTNMLIGRNENYDPQAAFNLIKLRLLERI